MTASAVRSRYRLYVVELGSFKVVDDRPAIYVGSTRKSAEARFREHLRGGFTASHRVHRYGTRPLRELFRGLPTYPTREAAEDAEVRLAAQLAERGYRVFGASGRPMPRRLVTVQSDIPAAARVGASRPAVAECTAGSRQSRNLAPCVSGSVSPTRTGIAICRSVVPRK